MKHRIRQRIINQFGLPVTKIETVQGELGSGILDKNGQEIFEGDKVIYDDGDTADVVFEDGQFFLKDKDEVVADWHNMLEIIGHAEE